MNKQDVMTLIAPLRELRSPINHPHPFPHENGSVLESRNVSKGNTVSILDQAVTRTLTDSAIRATAETVKPNKSSPLRYAGKSCSISEFFLTHATGSKILSQTSINEKKIVMIYFLLAKQREKLNTVQTQERVKKSLS